MLIFAASLGFMIGMGLKESYDSKEWFSLGDAILYVIFSLIISSCVAGLFSCVASMAGPKIDYDYSFKIYSADTTGSHDFYLIQENGNYTYTRKDGKGFRLESIPIDMTSIYYSDDEPAKVDVDAHKHSYNRDWNEKYKIYWFIGDDSIYVDKYIITIPSDTVIRRR